MTAALTSEQRERYRRHLDLPEIGVDGQRRLLDSRVLIVGAGGLGCPTALYLSAAGVGRLGIVDDDRVDLSNLQRQVLYRTDDLGRPKTEVAAERVRALNPDVAVDPHPLRLDATNALGLVRDYDVVVDGSDNFATRYLTNDACVMLGKPLVSGAILRFEGQAAVFDARSGPCYRCVFPEPPPPGSVPSCSEAGVLGVLPGLVAMVQATETLKLLAGVGELLHGRLLQIDALEMRFREFRFAKDPGCPVCGEQPTITELVDYARLCATEAGGRMHVVGEIEAGELARLREQGGDLLLLDVREHEEFALARIEGARLIPLGELPSRIGELLEWQRRLVVIHCHHGGRSARACALLMDAGFADVRNLTGGIEAWSRNVDPRVPRY